jgi:hypothetical protein
MCIKFVLPLDITRKLNMQLSEDRKTLLEVTQHDFANGTFIIPHSVTHICDGAFYACTGLTQVSIPHSVTHIGDGAFRGCTGLTQVSIPNSMTHIGDCAFWGCTSLTEVSIPNAVTHIGEGAFCGCTGLTKVSIPNSMTRIGDCAFGDCTGLTQVNIPNSVTHIGDGAFWGCTGLTQVSIPHSVTHIDSVAFRDCSGLTQVSIPHSVTNIGIGAFWGCTSLTEVSIPNAVTHISDSAFADCSTNLVMIIDAPNDQAYRRISNLLPQELQNRIMDFGLYPEINQAKQKTLMLKKTIAISSLPRELPEELTSIIWQFEGRFHRFHDVINRVPLPVKASELDRYKQALQQVVKQFSLEQELLQQKFVADKLQQYVQRTKTTIEEAGKRNKGFFDSPENQAKLTESKARIAVTEKLIAWLCGDKNMSFNENEKTLLSNPESIVASILEKNGIPVEELPKAPSSGRSLNK